MKWFTTDEWEKMGEGERHRERWRDPQRGIDTQREKEKEIDSNTNPLGKLELDSRCPREELQRSWPICRAKEREREIEREGARGNPSHGRKWGKWGVGCSSSSSSKCNAIVSRSRVAAVVQNGNSSACCSNNNTYTHTNTHIQIHIYTNKPHQHTSHTPHWARWKSLRMILLHLLLLLLQQRHAKWPPSYCPLPSCAAPSFGLHPLWPVPPLRQFALHWLVS